MEKIGELLMILIAAIGCSLGSIFFIWLIGIAITTAINAAIGTYYTWNFVYSTLVFAAFVILFIALGRR